MALSKFNLALADYDRVRKMSPTNKDAQNKYQECNKIVRRLAFEKAISSDHSTTSVADSIKLDDYGYFYFLTYSFLRKSFFP